MKETFTALAVVDFEAFQDIWMVVQSVLIIVLSIALLIETRGERTRLRARIAEIRGGSRLESVGEDSKSSH
ncbi:hypothetical protein [Microcystis phage Mwe-JY26]